MKTLNSIHKKTKKRRKEIIDAALLCFNELGYNNTGLTDICKRSHASIGSVYHLFKSKEQLAAEIYLEGIRDYQAGYIKALEKETGAEKGIFCIIKYHLQWVDANKDWSSYLFQMRHAEFMNPIEEEFAKLNSEFMGRVSNWFRTQIENKSIRRQPADLYPAILMGPCQEFTRMYLSGNSKTKIDIAIKELADAAWRSLKNK